MKCLLMLSTVFLLAACPVTKTNQLLSLRKKEKYFGCKIIRKNFTPRFFLFMIMYTRSSVS